MKKQKWVKRACPICSSKVQTKVFAEANYDFDKLDSYAFASRKIPETMHYRLILCPNCDLVYANPLPDLKNLAEHYHEAAFDSSEEAHCAARTYAGPLKAISRNIPDMKGALDIGTGDGAFLEELLEYGFSNVKGVEPSTAPIKAALPNIRPLIQKGLFEAKRFKKNSLSLVSCFQTFEHLYEPLIICKGAYSLLKKGGAFYIVSHNRSSLVNRLLGKKSPIMDIEHLQLFSPKSAKAMMIKAGFKDVTVRSLVNVYPLHYCVKLFPIPKKLKLILIPVLKTIKLGYLPIPMPVGNMAVVGYKK